jgi:steroid delta-isomerase-like uncharacterized protein
MKHPLLVVPLALLLCFAVSCKDKAAVAELEKYRAQAAVEEQNEELIRQMFNELDKANWDSYKGFFAPEFFYYLPSAASSPVKVIEMVEGVKMYFNAFPDLAHQIVELIAVKNKVIVRFIAKGTHNGMLEGLPPTGSAMEVSSIEIFTIKDGKIVEERQEADMLGMVQQLGMELKPKDVKK